MVVGDSHRRLLNAGYGFADRATGTADTTGTRFCIASIGKLFTAVAIGQLAEHGRLALDAPVGDYLTGLPAAIADHVTIAELLDMTAGLGDTVLTGQSARTLAGMMALIARERPPVHARGEVLPTATTTYILLGAVVQRLSGESYADYLRQRILDPAGMTHTGYAVYVPARVPGMAQATRSPDRVDHDISGRPQIANPSGAPTPRPATCSGSLRRLSATSCSPRP